MELHLHLSVAFRALDHKWGKVVDLDSSEESSYQLPCLPAVIERPTTTFSSEEFLKSRRIRPKPYSRYEERRRKSNVKRSDSFADISSSRIPLGEMEATSVDSGLDEDSRTLTQMVEDMTRLADSRKTLDSIFDRKIPVLKQWKDTAKNFIEKKCKRKVKS